MMPKFLSPAEASIPDGHLSQAFLDLEGREQSVGISNVIPLAVEMRPLQKTSSTPLIRRHTPCRCLHGKTLGCSTLQPPLQIVRTAKNNKAIP